jgi:hypothetical protein
MTTNILIHPRCTACESTFCRRVRSDERCSECGATSWTESHEKAFERVHERTDGWYGVQDYENVHPGDQVEVLVLGEWRPGRVTKLEAAGGFQVGNIPGRIEIEYRSFEGEGNSWRWPLSRRREPSWVGPFSSQEAAETVRYDHGPGYLVCGVCGWDGWKTKLPQHYADHHGPRSPIEVEGESRRRPHRRVLA